MVAGIVEQVASAGLEEQLDHVAALLAAIPASSYAAQSPATARRVAAKIRRLESMVQVHVGVAVRAVERLVPARDTRQILAADFGLDAQAAHRELKDARVLATVGATEQAAASGAISHTHATVIGRALKDLPTGTTTQQRELAEKSLITEASRLSPRDLATRARRITDLYAPETDVDATEDALLRHRETAARVRTTLAMWDNRDGTWSGRFTLPELQARMLKTVIDAHAAPRRAHLRPPDGGSGLADAAITPAGVHTTSAAAAAVATGFGGSSASGLSRVQQARIEAANNQSYDRKAGEALAAIIEHLPVDGLPTTGGTPARIMVTIEEARLRTAVAAATLSTGERVSAGELQRLACNHSILPAVLGGASIPVDLGRAQRLFTPYQRDALAGMDGGCVAPGCDRPPAWCEAHHGADPWNAGGRTDLADGYLLCCTHHHEAHANNWRFRRRADGAAEIDSGHGWQRNHRYRPSPGSREAELLNHSRPGAECSGTT